jgi:dTDP-4-dehydrorhamnose 3,5-epimerase
VSNGTAAAIVNPTTKISKVLVLADIAWKPNDNEMENTSFNDYDWNKWKKC